MYSKKIFVLGLLAFVFLILFLSCCEKNQVDAKESPGTIQTNNRKVGGISGVQDQLKKAIEENSNNNNNNNTNDTQLEQTDQTDDNNPTNEDEKQKQEASEQEPTKQDEQDQSDNETENEKENQDQENQQENNEEDSESDAEDEDDENPDDENSEPNLELGNVDYSEAKDKIIKFLEQFHEKVQKDYKLARSRLKKQQKRLVRAIADEESAKYEYEIAKQMKKGTKPLMSTLEYIKKLRESDFDPKQLIGKGYQLPARSCHDIYKNDAKAESGVYWIEPQKKSSKYSYRVYCEIDTAGEKGWTLVAWKNSGSKFATFTQNTNRQQLAYFNKHDLKVQNAGLNLHEFENGSQTDTDIKVVYQNNIRHRVFSPDEEKRGLVEFVSEITKDVPKDTEARVYISSAE